MAEPTPTETYKSFCTERDSLLATIATLEEAPTLANLDTLSAAKVRLDLVQAAMPGLCQAKDTYEAEQRFAAALALHGPRWSDAATAKVAALGDVSTKLADLLAAVDAYNAAHGVQTSVLMALHYSREFRIRFSMAPASLQQIFISVAQGDRSWLAKVPTFDAQG